MNQWRSPTAEKVFRKRRGVNARSVGTARSARRTISETDIGWADLILVMEQKHKSRLQEEFRDAIGRKTLHVLDIPDEYRYMDGELVDLIRLKVEPLISV